MTQYSFKRSEAVSFRSSRDERECKGSGYVVSETRAQAADGGILSQVLVERKELLEHVNQYKIEKDWVEHWTVWLIVEVALCSDCAHPLPFVTSFSATQ